MTTSEAMVELMKLRKVINKELHPKRVEAIDKAFDIMEKEMYRINICISDNEIKLVELV